MAVNEPRMFNPRVPDNIKREEVRFHFDRLSDSLVVFFRYPAQHATVNVPTSEFESLRVDAETEELGGFMIEDLLGHAVYHDQSYLQYAALAGIDGEEIAALRERVEAVAREQSEEEQRLHLIQNWVAHATVLQRYR